MLQTMKIININFFTIIITAGAVLYFISFMFFEVWFKGFAATSVKLSHVIVHIDLKGAPPKLEYLKLILPMLKDNGVTGLLMEYEDMFPYEGELLNLRAKNCYDRSQLKDFLTEAITSGFEIIPLVQTFGHLEYALKLQNYSHLREIPAYYDSICPTNVESRVLVKHMLQQVINFHNTISPLKHIHVGCDEVYHINKCSLCLSKGFSDGALFLDYIKYLSDVITGLSPKTTVLIWEDMLPKIHPLEWNKIGRINNIEPVYWDYRPRFNVSYVSLMHYHKTFKNIWAASAFKGADGKKATIPKLKTRLVNNFGWMNLIANFKYPSEIKVSYFKGIILTGWSRYSHLQPLCELLPVAIPSLILNLRMIRKFRFGVNVEDYDDDSKLIAFCVKYLSEDNIYFNCNKSLKEWNFDTKLCNFEGKELYDVLRRYDEMENNEIVHWHRKIMHLSANMYLLTYMNKNNFMELIDYWNDIVNYVKNMKAKIVKAMQKYYSDDVVNEYKTSKMYDTEEEITRFLKLLQTLQSKKVWKRRHVTDKLSGKAIF